MKIKLSILLVFITSYVVGQTWEWTDRIAGSGNSFVFNIALDENDSSIYSAGRVKGYCTFGENTNPITLTNYGDRDIFLTKYDYFGNLVWAKRYGSKMKDWGRIVEVSGTNVYFGGWYQDTCYFENDTLIANGIDNCFLAKSDNIGNIQWINSYGLAGNNLLYGSYINDEEEMYIVGDFTDTIQFDTTVLINTNKPVYPTSRAAYIAKIDSDGNSIWSKRFIATRNIVFFDVIEDSENNVYVVGDYYGTSNFGGSQSYTSAFRDPILIKLDSIGNLIWVDTPKGSGFDSFERIIIDENNDIIVSGKLTNWLTINSDSTLYSHDPIRSNGIIFKYDSDGTEAEVILHINSYGSSEIKGLDYNKQRLYFGGFIADTTIIRDDTIHINQSSLDLFYGSVDLSDNSLWYNYKGGIKADYLINLNLFSNERMILGGAFKDSVDFETVIFEPNGNEHDGLISSVSPPIRAILSDLESVFYCQNDTITLNNLSIGSIDSVEWVVNNAIILASSDKQLELELSDSDIVNVMLIVTNETESDSIIVEFEVYQLPSIVLPSDTFFCVGSDVVLNLGSEYYSYLWNSGDVDSMIVVDEEGIYSVLVSSEYGCSTFHSISVIEQIPPTIYLGSDSTLCNGETIELSVGEYFDTYLWSTGDTTSTIIVDTEGIYSVIAWDSLQCQSSDSINVSIDICDNVAHYHKNNSFKIYPNPFSDYFEINSDRNKAYSVSVYNSLNQRVFIKEFVNSKITINTQEFNSGVYFIIIESDNHEIYHYKLVKL